MPLKTPLSSLHTTQPPATSQHPCPRQTDKGGEGGGKPLSEVGLQGQQFKSPSCGPRPSGYAAQGNQQLPKRATPTASPRIPDPTGQRSPNPQMCNRTHSLVFVPTIPYTFVSVRRRALAQRPLIHVLSGSPPRKDNPTLCGCKRTQPRSIKLGSA